MSEKIVAGNSPHVGPRIDRRRATPETNVARFWSKVNKSGPVPPHAPELGPCWVWEGETNNKGYGRFPLYGSGKRRSSRPMAHRYVLEISGHSPGRLEVLHRCDNPACVRPTHLTVGTHAENMADAAVKNRMAYGMRHWNSVIRSVEDVSDIRRALNQGVSVRFLADKHGVDYVTILDIKNRRTWAHVV